MIESGIIIVALALLYSFFQNPQTLGLFTGSFGVFIFVLAIFFMFYNLFLFVVSKILTKFLNFASCSYIIYFLLIILTLVIGYFLANSTKNNIKQIYISSIVPFLMSSIITLLKFEGDFFSKMKKPITVNNNPKNP